MWSSPSERRRSARTRNTVSCWSSTTGRNPLIRVPTRAHGVGVGGVGLTALTGREDPGPGRHLGWHIEDLLADSKQPDRDVMTDPVAAPRPPSTTSSRRGLDPVDVTGHVGEAGLCRCRTDRHRGWSRRALITSIVADRLCGSIPITTHSACWCMHYSRCSIPMWLSSREGQRYLELGKPLLQPLPDLCRARPTHAMSEPHGTPRIQRGQPQ